MNRPTGGTGALALLLLAGCGGVSSTGITDTGPAGTVTGRFVREGGPLGPDGQQPAEQALHGTVTFTATGLPQVTVPVDRSGAFSARLAPATYHVSGRTPDIVEVDSGGVQHESVCSLPGTVRVTGQRTVKIAIICTVP